MEHQRFGLNLRGRLRVGCDVAVIAIECLPKVKEAKRNESQGGKSQEDVAVVQLFDRSKRVLHSFASRELKVAAA
jgi:hypothetical protein